MTGLLRAACAAGVLLVLAGCDRVPASPHQLRPDDAAVVAQGRTLYMQHCAACHGAQLQGQPDWQRRDARGRLPAPPHDASGHTWHHPDEVLFRITREGVGPVAGLPGYATDMPVYAGVLSDAEIVAVLSFIQSQWPAEIRRRQREVDEAARRNR